MTRSAWRRAISQTTSAADTPLREVAETAPGYLEWMLGEDFPEETLAILRDAQEGSLPDPGAGPRDVPLGETPGLEQG